MNSAAKCNVRNTTFAKEGDKLYEKEMENYNRDRGCADPAGAGSARLRQGGRQENGSRRCPAVLYGGSGRHCHQDRDHR